MAFWNRTKSFEAATSRDTHSALKPTLSWVHLVGLGVGGIVGTGIYTLTGVGAGMAGSGSDPVVRRSPASSAPLPRSPTPRWRR